MENQDDLPIHEPALETLITNLIFRIQEQTSIENLLRETLDHLNKETVLDLLQRAFTRLNQEFQKNETESNELLEAINHIDAAMRILGFYPNWDSCSALKIDKFKKEKQMNEEFTLFWNGPLSQWEESYFELDDVEYNCAEQYMMAEKARLFNDQETLDQIMDSEDPATQKKLGRLVNDFVEATWQEEENNGRPRCWNIVWRGNMAKFSQNSHLLRELLATKGTSCVEASPRDVVWGIGLRATDPGAKYRESWLGTNWLGEVLDSVREFLSVDSRIYNSSQDSRMP